jgi:hypothetical protein
MISEMTGPVSLSWYLGLLLLMVALHRRLLPSNGYVLRRP